MRAMLQNDTRDIIDLPKGQKSVGCRWVFRLKYRVDGTLNRHKVRLVARGYTQIYGVDYQETFAPVAKMNTMRIIISLAVYSKKKLSPWQSILTGHCYNMILKKPS